MTKIEVSKLCHGLYRIHWKSGGSSLASVGSMCDGRRWLAPTNWVADHRLGHTPGGFGSDWKTVSSVKLIMSSLESR